jgi:hypothetical protein
MIQLYHILVHESIQPGGAGVRDPLEAGAARWLLLIHQIPPKPDYFRVKVWRRLQRLGAVAIKNSVYVLPLSPQAQEDFQWVRREITEGSGDAFVCEARFVEGLSDEQIEALFHAARSADYGPIAEDVKQVVEQSAGGFASEERRAQVAAETVRLRRHFEEVAAIDFFGAPERELLQSLLAEIEAQLRRAAGAESEKGSSGALGAEWRGRTWVTRRGVHVDRIASAWLIRRFIDAEASFKFATSTGYAPGREELRFDMFDAEFTHEGDRCTFEVLLQRFDLEDLALHALGEIVHDIDLKDGKFGRPEAAGIDHLIAGIAMAHKDDAARLERGGAVFADLYTYFRRKSERDRRRAEEDGA